LTLEPFIAAKAKAHQRQAGGAVPHKLAEALDTRATLAQMSQVSHETLRKAKVIAQEADERTKEALRRGERSIHSVYCELRPKEASTHPEAQTLGADGLPTAPLFPHELTPDGFSLEPDPPDDGEEWDNLLETIEDLIDDWGVVLEGINARGGFAAFFEAWPEEHRFQFVERGRTFVANLTAVLDEADATFKTITLER